MYLRAVVFPDRPEPNIRMLQPPESTGGGVNTKDLSGIWTDSSISSITIVEKMSASFQEFLKSGKKILDDTKSPAPPKIKGKVGLKEGIAETDPHKILIRRVIQEKPKKPDLVVELKKFITAAETL